MFAILNMTFYDSYLTGWDSKYHWEFWRPYTAIRAGDTDGNRRTVSDASWQSYLETPPVQDYPSTHSALGAGAAEVLQRSFKTSRVPFSMESSTALPTNHVRSFDTFTQAVDDTVREALVAVERQVERVVGIRYSLDDREHPDVSREGELAQRLDEGPLPIDGLMEPLLVLLQCTERSNPLLDRTPAASRLTGRSATQMCPARGSASEHTHAR